MLTSAVNDSAASQSSSGQVVDAKANTGEFDLVMAAMQVLIIPGTSVAFQTKDESGGGKSSSTGTASLELVAPQGLNSLVSATANDSGKDVGQISEGAELSPGMQATQAAMVAQNREIVLNAAITTTGKSLSHVSTMAQNDGQMYLVKPRASLAGNVFPSNSETRTTVAQNQETVLNPAMTITGKSLPQLSTTVQNNGQMPPIKTGLNQAVENGVNDTAVSPVRGEIKQAILDQQVMSRTSLVGNVFQSVSETRVKEVSVADEMVQVMGKEPGINTENAKVLRTYSPDKIEPLKSGLETENSSTIENSPQQNAAPATILSEVNLAESPKSVALPDLKDRLVQEIKNVLDTDKGGLQRQVQLKLEPEHLGQLTIKLFFDHDALSAHFYTGNNHVKEILEGSLQQLRDSLSQHDLRLNEALVFAGDDGRGGMGRSFEERNGRAWSSHNGYNNRTYTNEQVDSVNFIAAATDSSRVNYLI